MKRISILGSTGSIGESGLKVIGEHSAEFKVRSLSTNSNIDVLYRQILLFRPDFVAVTDTGSGVKLRSRLKNKETKVLIGPESLQALAEDKGADQILLAVSGAAALRPLLKAIDSGKSVALANKEALVMAGSLIMERAKKKKAQIMPVDSEQSAIWQCLNGQAQNRLKTIYLTASGGPFWKSSKTDFKKVSVQKVLRHPRWKMGRKITVDSATLMNKGLEVLEAMHLFAVSPKQIKIVVHPQAVIHSMVEFIDGVILAQLSVTDMRIPIQYAFSFPQRLDSGLSGLDFYKMKSLDFFPPDFKRFPCLSLSYQAAKQLGTAPCALNAANEVGVAEFLRGRVRFFDIPVIIEKVLSRHRNTKDAGLDDILAADAWARHQAYQIINKN